MTAPGNPTNPAEHARTAAERERARESAMSHLKQASAEIDKARQETTAEVRRNLDSALERLRDVSGELQQRAHDQTSEWQDALERAPDEARRDMGRRAIHAQRTPEALRELSAEIGKREAELVRSAPKGEGAKS